LSRSSASGSAIPRLGRARPDGAYLELSARRAGGVRGRPTIAFSGVTDLQHEAWELVEGLAPAYGDHWWYISLLAFTRQDQSRFDDAGMLAESALSCEPSSGPRSTPRPM